VVQVVECLVGKREAPEFKPQCCPKNKTKPTTTHFCIVVVIYS
jgi:hypothetical protein